ncbi:MAG: hypothetical protein CVU88_07095 [Firmicutes bacterium HGW-Firmicutes-13]|jgi:hypothetical protein|nr:MAG: hypothetical protein CVV44_19030 [Spirochaetae bacterium HGW-Spirochaetae-1]PKM79183.1 MAG: hypothetical protein CVU88_07095 [Firmicutes bacterium HGW-Firmicutes-13]
MNADTFWNIIAVYNGQTWIIQLIFMLLIALSFILTVRNKLQWLPKIILGIANMYMGIVFFLYYGTEPVQHYFAAPLFMAAGALFLREGIKYRNDAFTPFNGIQWVLFIMVLLYPGVSFLLGNSFPRMVVYIMPCPLISFSIVMYSGYKRKNILLLVLLILWGLTGIKSFFFNALEDTILLICGIYCLRLLFSELKKRGKMTNVITQ